MSQNGRYCLTCDSETYTKEQLARLLHRDSDWVEKNVLYPCHSATRKPLAVCGDCGEEFGLQPACPVCGSRQVELVAGCPFVRLGIETLICAEDFKLWLRQRACSRKRKAWAKQLAEAEGITDAA